MRIYASCCAVVAVLALPAGAGTARAQGFGVSGGAHVNPDQLQAGALYEFPTTNERLRFRPSVSIGLGNDATLVAGNADVLYDLNLWRRSAWQPYVGGGPAINHYRLELYNETEAGMTALAGLQHAGGWWSEVRLGFFESPRVTATLGYSFGTRQTRSRARPRR